MSRIYVEHTGLTRKYPQFANPQFLGSFRNRKYAKKIRKFRWRPGPQIANPQLCLEKRIVSDPETHCLPRIFSLPYERTFYTTKRHVTVTVSKTKSRPEI